MQKIYFLSALLLFSNFAFAGKYPPTTECGIILSNDPLFAAIEGSVLDQPRVQDLAMMRAGSLPRPILLVGQMGTEKTKLLKALVEKARQSNIPAYVFNTNGIRVAEIPNGSLVVLDYAPEYFSYRDGTYWDHLVMTLEHLNQLKKKGNVTALLTMTSDAFNNASGDPMGRSIFDRFDIIRMEYGRPR